MDARIAQLFAIAALTFGSTLVEATVQRTFVASSGNDANPCSIAQPCRSFGAAIAKTVSGGEVIALDSAGYGVVTITQSVSMIAPQGVYAGISVPSGQSGIVVNAPGGTVALRGLSITGVGGGIGILLVEADRLRIEGCIVSNLTSAGISLTASGSETIVLDTIVRDNGGAGVLLIADATAAFDGLRVEHNGGDGIYVVAAGLTASATISRSLLSHNGGNGVVVAKPSGSTVTVVALEESTVSYNAGNGVLVGGTSDGIAYAVVGHNTISGNAQSGVAAVAGSGFPNTVIVGGNTFANNSLGDTKVDGASSRLYASANSFGSSFAFVTQNGALTYSFQDNSGQGSPSGTAPVPVGRF